MYGGDEVFSAFCGGSVHRGDAEDASQKNLIKTFATQVRSWLHVQSQNAVQRTKSFTILEIICSYLMKVERQTVNHKQLQLVYNGLCSMCSSNLSDSERRDLEWCYQFISVGPLLTLLFYLFWLTFLHICCQSFLHFNISSLAANLKMAFHIVTLLSSLLSCPCAGSIFFILCSFWKDCRNSFLSSGGELHWDNWRHLWNFCYRRHW